MNSPFTSPSRTALFGTLAVAGLIALSGCGLVEAVLAETPDSPSDTTNTETPAPPSVEVNEIAVTTHTVGPVEFDLPKNWVQADLSGNTAVAGNQAIEFFDIFYDEADSGSPQAMIMVTSTAPERAEPMSEQELKDSTEFLAQALAADDEQVLYDRVANSGLGCDSPTQWELIRPVELSSSSGQTGHHHSYEYQYTCTSGGQPIWGWSWAGYAADSRSSSITLTATADYYEQNRDQLNVVPHTLRLPQALPPIE